jgi:hypothetical protein
MGGAFARRAIINGDYFTLFQNIDTFEENGMVRRMHYKCFAMRTARLDRGD